MGQACCKSTYDTQNQLVAHESKCFMISCMDFRLIDDMVQAMDVMGYNNNYDQFICAGASLGLTQKKYPHWGQTALDHLEIGKDLHKFWEIVIIDHLDCGAYKKFYPGLKPEEELVKHRFHLQEAYNMLAKKFPKFHYRAFIMDISGKFEEVNIKLDASLYDEKNADFEKSKFLSDIHTGHE